MPAIYTSTETGACACAWCYKGVLTLYGLLCWLLAVGCWLLAVGCWLLAVCCLLFSTLCLLLVCSLLLYCYCHRDDYKQYYRPGNDYGAKKMIPITGSLRTMPIKSKDYGTKTIHNFFLEEMTEFGNFRIAKFGSKNKQLVELLVQTLQNRIVTKKHLQLQQK